MMVKNSFTDLKIVLILTFLSIIFLFIPSLNQYPQNMVSYAFILLLPGYSLLATIKPRVNEITVFKRFLFSLVLGVILIVVAYSLWKYTPLMTYLNPLIGYLSPLEVYITSLETYVPLVLILSTILIVDLVLIAWARRRGLKYTENLTEEEKKPETSEKNKIQQFKKKRFYSLDLLMLFLVNIICLAVLQLTNQPYYHTITEFLLILFLPGYALINIIYPGKDALDGIGRVIYGFASSIALTTMVGLILNYTSYSKLIDPILYTLSGLTIIFFLAAYLRRRRIPEENRFSADFSGLFKGLGEGFFREPKTEKILTSMLVISLMLVAFTTFITANQDGERYTDFYVLGADGNPVNSINLTSGESDNLTISVINQENKKTNYRLLVTSGGNVLMDQTITLKNEEKRDIPFTFTVGNPGTRDMEFNLYKLPDNANVYKSLKISLNVAENLELIAEEAATVGSEQF